MFLRVLGLLLLSYGVFLALAHASSTTATTTASHSPLETFDDYADNATTTNTTLTTAISGATSSFRTVTDLTIDRVTVFPHYTLMTHVDVRDGPTARKRDDEAVPAFVRRCAREALRDPTCVALVVYATDDDVRCVCKRRSTEARESSSGAVIDAITSARTAWTLRETEPHEGAVLFLRTDLLRDGTVEAPVDDARDFQAPIVITEVDAATSATGFALDQPTTYDDDEPDHRTLDAYGVFDSPPTVWSTPQPDAPKCLTPACRGDKATCPVQLSDTYAAPSTNSRIGSILPAFTYTECR